MSRPKPGQMPPHIDAVYDAQLISALHTFHALQNPTPHLEALQAESGRDQDQHPLQYFPQLEPFHPNYSAHTVAATVQMQVGEVGAMFERKSGLEHLTAMELWTGFKGYGEDIAHPIYDRSLWVDRAGKRMLISSILPQPSLLKHIHDTYKRRVQSHHLVKFIENSIIALGDRSPKPSDLV